MALINKQNVKLRLLEEARRQGKSRLVRVSAETLDWIEDMVKEKIQNVVSMSPHGGPKTIYPPVRKGE